MSAYDRIGGTYVRTRRSDPRIAQQIARALGDARTRGQRRRGQRRLRAARPRRRRRRALRGDARAARAGAARAVQASAEALPFEAGSFDAALAVLTMHHWSDWRAGVAEMRRVAPKRRVMLTFDPAYIAQYWLVRDYLPEMGVKDEPRFPPLEVVAEALGGADIVPVPIAHDCADGFLCAWWKRPLAYLDDDVRANISTFALLDPAEVAEAMERLERDVADGTWAERNAELLAHDEADFGYRLLVAEGR